MKYVVIVNNDVDQLKIEKQFIKNKHIEAEILVFTDPFMAAKYICNNKVVRVYVDVDLKPVNGFEFLKVLRKNTLNVEVYLIADTNIYKEDALRESADGYIVRKDILGQ